MSKTHKTPETHSSPSSPLFCESVKSTNTSAHNIFPPKTILRLSYDLSGTRIMTPDGFERLEDDAIITKTMCEKCFVGNIRLNVWSPVPDLHVGLRSRTVGDCVIIKL